MVSNHTTGIMVNLPLVNLPLSRPFAAVYVSRQRKPTFPTPKVGLLSPEMKIYRFKGRLLLTRDINCLYGVVMILISRFTRRITHRYLLKPSFPLL